MNMAFQPIGGSNTNGSTTPNRTVQAAGTHFAYRQLGAATGVPVVLLNQWGANLDNFDPRIVEPLAAIRPVFALDYRGIGRSGGEAPLTVAEMTDDVIAAIGALGLEQIDLIGFSLGGFVAQDVALKAPALVRSEEHKSGLQSLMRISYAVFCL